jgi:uncharacterized protein YjbJ (UPF0337 family)
LRFGDPGYPVPDRKPQERKQMSAEEIHNKDDAKGRVKEAAGNLSGDKDLKREGQVDQAGGKAKEGIERLTDKVKDVLKRD